jgi:hypothetical protein
LDAIKIKIKIGWLKYVHILKYIIIGHGKTTFTYLLPAPLPHKKCLFDTSSLEI